jgi:hypothetical protein
VIIQCCRITYTTVSKQQCISHLSDARMQTPFRRRNGSNMKEQIVPCHRKRDARRVGGVPVTGVWRTVSAQKNGRPFFVCGSVSQETSKGYSLIYHPTTSHEIRHLKRLISRNALRLSDLPSKSADDFSNQ